MFYSRPLVFVLLTLCFITFSTSAEIFVPNSSAHSVTVFADGADGNAAPLRIITGPSTDLSLPFAVAVDPIHQELFVSNLSSDEITVYNLGDDGDAAPLRKISGAATGLSSPIGLHVNLRHDELVVRNFGGSTILTFARSAADNASPLRTLEGPSTLIVADTADLFVDSVHGEIVVANRDDTDSSILVFDRLADGDVAPIRQIMGPSTGLDDCYGVFVDTLHGEIFVANGPAQTVTVYDRTASGDASPLRTLSDDGFGSLSVPTGVALDLEGDFLWISNQSSSTVSIFARDASGPQAPLRQLEGAVTTLNNPSILDYPNDPTIFGDGFESGDTSAWSQVLPITPMASKLTSRTTP